MDARSCDLAPSHFCTPSPKNSFLRGALYLWLLLVWSEAMWRFEVRNCDFKTNITQTTTALARPVEMNIKILRGQRVISDADSANSMGVSVKRLNQQVTRNKHRFPADFIFRLSRAGHKN